MSDLRSQRWAKTCGLALVPLFDSDRHNGEQHSVLLDGGFGSFALSETSQELWKEKQIADWAWSSNLPHHVTVTEKVVAVTRWDKSRPELLSLKSVESQLEAFYEYLTLDRVRSNQRVVEYVLNMFRRVRSLLADARIPDEKSIDVFLAIFARGIAQEKGSKVKPVQVGEADEIIQRLSSSGLANLTGEDSFKTGPFSLYPSMAVRHAGSEIFQEAHFALMRAPEVDLFGYTGPAEAKAVTRGGAHFTPAPLARSVAEQALSEIADIQKRTALVVSDPACGSGAFLHEALRTLRRMGFEGHLTLVGTDISPAAISMANFVVRNSIDDWTPSGGITLDLRVCDSLRLPSIRADVVLMNPPFISWAGLSGEQRDQMRELLGDTLGGRADFSMAFVTKAIEGLLPGGALGVLLPASLLTLQAAEDWRKELLQKVDMKLIASIGDYGLFAHALVQVAAAVFRKPTPLNARLEKTVALISSDSPEATGNALRSLRRGEIEQGNDAWRIFEFPSDRFRERPTWRITSPAVDRAIKRLFDAGISKVGELFEVKQGVRSGKNDVFVLSHSQYLELSVRERKYFRPALLNDSVQQGRLTRDYWIFYPYGEREILVESQLEKLLPRYSKRLFSVAESLKLRSSIVRSNRQDWWRLSEPRNTWATGTAPRLVSKYFGGVGGFAVDKTSEFVVVQGYAWLPKWTEPGSDDVQTNGLDVTEILYSYCALMNSRLFAKLLTLFSPHVAGGQFDLSPRYVDGVPVPNLADLCRDERAGHLVSRLSLLGSDISVFDAEWNIEVDRIVGELYGGEFFEQF